MDGCLKCETKQILETAIKTRWNIIPAQQREGVRNFISNLIIKLCSSEASARREHSLLAKLNVVLVQILKQDWPQRWPTFIPDIVGAAKTSEVLCENVMVILKLLSEEVFDFSRDELTQAKTRQLKMSLNQEFAQIHALCVFVLTASSQTTLLKCTLETLLAYLSWIPIGYIFEGQLVEVLLSMFSNPELKCLSLQCLTEVVTLTVPEYEPHIYQLYIVLFSKLEQEMFVGDAGPQRVYAEGTDADKDFIQQLAIFLVSFFSGHRAYLEQDTSRHQSLVVGLEYLVQISYVDSLEVLKICLDYWHSLLKHLFELHCSSVMGPVALPGLSAAPAFQGSGEGLQAGLHLYTATLSQLRLLMIARMAKPEEVIVVEDENGNVIRERLKDNDELTRYKMMREALVYLSHLDHDDTESQMISKLKKQLNGSEFGWGPLNRLCWAIGSVSGTFSEEQENRFLVSVIRDLLNLCEHTRGKDHKAVIASNIMYVVGQYPKFLRQHWKFLKTVVNKLFEFMHETHPGVQDMACDTFLKICNKCKKKFVVVQAGEAEPFLAELVRNLPSVIDKLEDHQVHIFFEAAAVIVAVESEPQQRSVYLARLMDPPNGTWDTILNQGFPDGNPDFGFFSRQDISKSITSILQTNIAACMSLGPSFESQLQRIFPGIIKIYECYAVLVERQLATGGVHAAKTSVVRHLRVVKGSVLRLLTLFIESSAGSQDTLQQIAVSLGEPILKDYGKCASPDAREAGVLSLYAVMIDKLGESAQPLLPHLLEYTFESTLSMITANFEDYPDHRYNFFSLLRTIATHCFGALFVLPGAEFNRVMDAVIWAIRHAEKNIADVGLTTLFRLLRSVSQSQHCVPFYRAYYMRLLEEIFALLTDTFHKPGFSMHATILKYMLSLLDNGGALANDPIWEGPGNLYSSNRAYVHGKLEEILVTSFPNFSKQQITQFLNGLFKFQGTDQTAFKSHLRDFLVASKMYSGDEPVFESDLGNEYADHVPAQPNQGGLATASLNAEDMNS